MLKRLSMFFAGLCLGVLIFGDAAYAASVIASPSTHHVTVDGVPVSVEAYNINGNNYFQLRDLAQLVGFNVIWDNTTRTVEIHTDEGYTDPEIPAEQPDHTALLDSSDSGALYNIRVEIVEWTNALRSEHGLPALAMDDNLMAAAQVRAEEAAANLAYRHERPDGSDNDTVLWHTGTLLMGENMGMKDMSGQSLDELAELQVDSWEQSDSHCRNMLHTIYHSMGTGVAQDEYGMYYIVQLFAGGDYTITGIDAPILP